MNILLDQFFLNRKIFYHVSEHCASFGTKNPIWPLYWSCKLFSRKTLCLKKKLHFVPTIFFLNIFCIVSWYFFVVFQSRWSVLAKLGVKITSRAQRSTKPVQRCRETTLETTGEQRYEQLGTTLETTGEQRYCFS